LPRPSQWHGAPAFPAGPSGGSLRCPRLAAGASRHDDDDGVLLFRSSWKKKQRTPLALSTAASIHGVD
jgi:hypothetical protein